MAPQKDTSPSPWLKCMSPMDSLAPSTNTGKYTWGRGRGGTAEHTAASHTVVDLMVQQGAADRLQGHEMHISKVRKLLQHPAALPQLQPTAGLQHLSVGVQPVQAQQQHLAGIPSPRPPCSPC